MLKSGITAIVGNYGSGKSEISINLALLLRSLKPKDKTVFLADLDVVNPYFRSREGAELLREKDIELIVTAEKFRDVDLPYMPTELLGKLQNKDSVGILDIGGEATGARVLPRYGKELRNINADIFFVVNVKRPGAKTVRENIDCINRIEETSGLKITGLINNTHLCDETSSREVIQGAEVSTEIAEIAGIPLALHGVTIKNLNEDPALETDLKSRFQGEILSMNIFLKKPWEVR